MRKFDSAFEKYGVEEMRLYFDGWSVTSSKEDFWVAFMFFFNERASKIDKNFNVKKGTPLKDIIASRSVEWCERLYSDMFRVLDSQPWRVGRCAVKLMTSLYLDVRPYLWEFEGLYDAFNECCFKAWENMKENGALKTSENSPFLIPMEKKQ
jgi:hypothetical protein